MIRTLDQGADLVDIASDRHANWGMSNKTVEAPMSTNGNMRWKFNEHQKPEIAGGVRKSVVERLIIHVGPQKTGSKTIQRNFDNYRDFFLRYGLVYPEGVWHGQLTSWALDGDPSCTYNRWARRFDLHANSTADAIYLKSLQDQLVRDGLKYALLSYEGFSSIPEKAFGRIKEVLTPLCRDLLILFYTRHHFSRVSSEMSTAIAHGRKIAPREGFRPYLEILKRLSAPFDGNKVIVRKLEGDCLFEGDIILDVLSHFAPELAREVARSRLVFARENESLSVPGFQVAQILSDKLTPNGNRRLRARYLHEISNIKGEKFSMSEPEWREIEACSNVDLRALNDQYKIEFNTETAPRFRSSDDMLSEEEARKLAGEIVERVEG